MNLNFKSKFSPDDFHHVAFKTTNYDEMVEFYKKLFGCEPLYQSNQIIDMLVNHAINETKNSFNILKKELNLITYDDLIKRT